MAKQRIRLTEGDLHRVIKESVGRVLTELDWKTYANATKAALAKTDLSDFPQEWPLKQR